MTLFTTFIFVIGLLLASPPALAPQDAWLDHARSGPSGPDAGSNWEELTSVKSVCRRYPEEVEDLLTALDEERPGLGAVRKAAAEGRIVDASRKLLDYYRTAETTSWLQTYAPTDTAGPVHTARRVLEDTYRFYGQTATFPRKPGGGLDWTYRGPTEDDEWRKALHRHFPMQALLDAYLTTGNDAFVCQLDRNLRDWIVHSWPYPGQKSDDPFWGELGVSFRVEAWANVFFALQDDENLHLGTRLLMLMSLRQHGHSLRTFHGGNNLATKELASLALLSAAWPEFASSDGWMQYAVQTLGDELNQQVYPGGAQKELTTHYHWISLRNFEQVRDLAERVGASVPARYRENLVRMHKYLAFVMRPNGTGPLNNDSDLRPLRSTIAEAADQYDNPQWRYVASDGKTGERPDGPPSRVFPWAGQLVSRSDWSADAHWSFFDVGPWGRAPPAQRQIASVRSRRGARSSGRRRTLCVQRRRSPALPTGICQALARSQRRDDRRTRTGTGRERFRPAPPGGAGANPRLHRFCARQRLAVRGEHGRASASGSVPAGQGLGRNGSYRERPASRDRDDLALPSRVCCREGWT